MAVVAVTHVNGSYREMLYMAVGDSKTTTRCSLGYQKVIIFIGVNRQVATSKSVSFLEKVGKLLEENK